MAVKRIVTDIASSQVDAARSFYGEVLDLEVAMDLGWILTFTAQELGGAPQISIASEGGGRPRMMTTAKLKVAIALMADKENAARDVAEQLGVSLSTLYTYVDCKGRPKPLATELLRSESSRTRPSMTGVGTAA